VRAGFETLSGNHIQISPPFTISEAEVDCLVGALDESLKVVTREVDAKVHRG
jgi:4-aminobutyrate aminotransferase-like enzyme